MPFVGSRVSTSALTCANRARGVYLTGAFTHRESHCAGRKCLLKYIYLPFFIYLDPHRGLCCVPPSRFLRLFRLGLCVCSVKEMITLIMCTYCTLKTEGKALAIAIEI